MSASQHEGLNAAKLDWLEVESVFNPIKLSGSFIYQQV